MADVVIYTKDWCAFCHRARALLSAKGVDYTNIDIEQGGAGLEEEMRVRSRRTSVPQIFIANRHIGGFDDLLELEAAGDLDALLDASSDAERYLTTRRHSSPQPRTGVSI